MPATPPPPPPGPSSVPAKRSPWRWVLIGLALLFLAMALWSSLNPFGEADYVAVSHGDHVHYVPRDWDGSTSISNFPSVPPGPNERILPDGRVVPKQ